MKKCALIFFLLLFIACAAKAPPVALITVEPMGALPEYSFTETNDGMICLDAAGKAAYFKEQELMIERNNYLAQKLKDMGAVFLPKVEKPQ
jgi:hypothetical protein